MPNLSWRVILRRITTAGPYINSEFSTWVLSLVVVAGILLIAVTDKTVGPEISLASLYVLPLALSALIHPLRASVLLATVCLVMHHLVGPSAKMGPVHLTHDVATLSGYVFVVLVVNRLGHQRTRLAEAAERQRDELASEIQLAAEVQQNILPRTVPSLPGFDIAAKMHPAKAVAGDYYGFIEQADGSFAIVIADVAGKGVAAGLLMPSIEIALRLNSARCANANEVIRDFNEVVCRVTGGSRFISLFYGRLSPPSRTLEYTNAGHNPPLLLRKDKARELCSGGPVLGVVPQCCYETELVQLESGDVLILYTDGLVEAENSEGEFYAAHRLETTAFAFVDQTAERIAEVIYESVRRFRGTDELEDDATLLVVRVL